MKQINKSNITMKKDEDKAHWCILCDTLDRCDDWCIFCDVRDIPDKEQEYTI
ncbi:hypothetical protein [Oceanirhabdus sp. W0125-5]|uniref:hypothetical protein n=1 Tax=Oceanirhabdus sp. W0125-5 TaxID=2999116 RepID=UPI0022F33BFB|nr:hypothetical protein [Oceanirhabdus sp. W0125-5]WBW97748.1 hypothetical protein OW730_02915 [Oceanirhabdus sp. W0125-5]